ncbi:MAG: GDP-mannose 4,6-dehydratase, partial [Acidobacteriota bacterium]
VQELHVLSGDIRDPFFTARAAKDCDIVFHLAALIPIPYSYLSPAEFVETNIRGTLNMLEACRRNTVGRMIHTSTSETYGTARYTPIDEKHPLQGQSPYAASKIGADKLVESYWCSFETPVVTLRPFNTYGPRQSARAFLPAVIIQALAGKVIRVGSLDPVRDMNYVEDTVDGFVRAGVSPGVEGLTLNLGSGRGTTMRDLLNIALAATGVEARVETDPVRVRPGRSEVLELICDASLAREKLDWSNRYSVENGVERTVDWLRNHLEDYRPDAYAV